VTAREVLDGIKARLAAATPGPWKAEPVESGSFAHIESRVYSLRGSHILLSPTDGEAGQAKTTDAEFIAAAPADVARLTAAVEAVLALHKEVEGYRFGAVPGAAPDYGVCSTCFTDDERPAPWPCPTVAAIENALKEGQ
jgi:hypothetical protein